jgi:hypothetical protein
MMGHRRQQLRVEWVEPLRLSPKRSGYVIDFCQAQIMPLAMLYRRPQHPERAVTGLVPGRRAKVPSQISRMAALLSAVRIPTVPVADASLRGMLPNGPRWRSPGGNSNCCGWSWRRSRDRWERPAGRP